MSQVTHFSQELFFKVKVPKIIGYLVTINNYCRGSESQGQGKREIMKEKEGKNEKGKNEEGKYEKGKNEKGKEREKEREREGKRETHTCIFFSSRLNLLKQMKKSCLIS